MKKQFRYGDRVRVKLPGKKAFKGIVYSEYKEPGQMRRICITGPDGCGLAYPVCFVTPVKRPWLTGIRQVLTTRPSPPTT